MAGDLHKQRAGDKAPACTVLSVQQSLTQTSMTPVPHPPCSHHLTLRDVFVSPDEKSPRRETRCRCGRGETKMGAALNGISMDALGSGESTRTGALHQTESALRVTEVQTRKSKYTIFYK